MTNYLIYYLKYVKIIIYLKILVFKAVINRYHINFNLKNMPSEINDQSENFLFSKKLSKSEFGLWGNITKNPRY